METVDVLLSGNILPGADLAGAAAQLSGLTGLDQEQTRALISSGREKVVKRGVSAATGQKYLDKLTSIGIEARLRPAAAPAIPPAVADPQSVRQAAGQLSPSLPPKTDTVAPQAAQAAAAAQTSTINPYSAPKAAMDERSSRTGLEGGWRGSAAKVPASHGYHWFKDAWSLFSSQKGTWIGAILLIFLITTGVSAVLALVSPLLSNIANGFLWVFFAGGIAIMAHRQSEGETVGVFSVLSGFSQKPVQLLLIGLISIFYGALLFGLGVLFVGQDTIIALTSGKATVELAQPNARVFLVFLGGMILLLPLALGGVFAPALVSLAEKSAFAGLYKGFCAGLKNWSAFLVNGLTLMAICLGFGIAAGLLAGLGAAFSGGSMAVLLLIGLVLLLLGLPLMCALYIMSYTASRDIFYDEA